MDIDTQIQLVCNDNATLIGNPLATCMEDGNNIRLNQNQMAVTSLTGTWDNANMSCQTGVSIKSNCPMSQVPTPPVNGFIDQKSLIEAANGIKDFVEYKCRPGYRVVGVNISTCIIDGYWTDPNVTCQGKFIIFCYLL